MSSKVNYGYYKRYLELNVAYFDTVLSRGVRVTESPHIKAYAGVTYFLDYPDIGPLPFEISLSKKYLQKYPDDLDNILLHEMIHIKLKSTAHDEAFLEELTKLQKMGVSVDLYGKYLEI